MVRSFPQFAAPALPWRYLVFSLRGRSGLLEVFLMRFNIGIYLPHRLLLQPFYYSFQMRHFTKTICIQLCCWRRCWMGLDVRSSVDLQRILPPFLSLLTSD